MAIREVKESPLDQGQDEEIIYQITTTPWGSSPTAPAVVVKDEINDDAEVTATVMPSGSPTVNGDVITLPTLKLLTAGRSYRVEVKFTAGGNIWETYFRVRAKQ